MLRSVCKLKRINGLYFRYKNIKAHSCTKNFDPVAKLWLKTGAHTKYALISPYIWFRQEKMGFMFIILFFYPIALDLKAENLILGFVINSQIFGRATVFDDNLALRWSDRRRVVEKYFLRNVSVFTFSNLKKTTKGADGNKSNGLKKLTMSVRIIGYFKVMT